MCWGGRGASLGKEKEARSLEAKRKNISAREAAAYKGGGSGDCTPIRKIDLKLRAGGKKLTAEIQKGNTKCRTREAQGGKCELKSRQINHKDKFKRL